MQSNDFLTPVRGKRLSRSKHYTDCVTSNIIDKQSTNNSKCFKTVQCKTEIYKNSFFSRNIIDWNHLDQIILCGQKKLTALGKLSIIGTSKLLFSQLSPVASPLKGPAMYRFRKSCKNYRYLCQRTFLYLYLLVSSLIMINIENRFFQYLLFSDREPADNVKMVNDLKNGPEVSH